MKKLKHDINESFHVPDVRSKINLNEIHIEPAPQHNKTPLFLRRLNLSLSFSFVLLLMVTFGFMYFTRPNSVTPGRTRQTLHAQALNSFGVVSSSMMFHQTEKEELGMLPQSAKTDPKAFITHIDSINQYFSMIELLVGPKSDMLVSDETESDEEGYLYQVRFHYKDANAISHSFIFHYNEEVKDDDEIYQEGLFIIGNERLYIEIEREIEGDEVESDYIVYKDKALKKKNYVVMSTEKDDEGQYFSYKIYKSGNLTTESFVKLELDDDDEIEMEFYLLDKVNNIKFKIKASNDNKHKTVKGYYELEVPNKQKEVGSVTVEITYNQEKDIYEYTYTLDDKSIVKGERNIQ